MSLPPFQDRLLEVQRASLRTRFAGPTKAPVALLLHGFAETWYAWRHVVRPLLEGGYRVVIPDLRGLGGSSRPPADGYSADLVADDVVRLLDHAEARTAVVIGHDWGGTMGWYAAAKHPDRVSHLVAVAAPHPSVGGLLHPSALLGTSWTVLFKYPPPLFAEAMFNDWRKRMLLSNLVKNVREGVLTPEDKGVYVDAWGREGTVEAWHHWLAGVKGPCGRVSAPALVAWGARDPIAPPSQADASVGQCERGQALKIDAGHYPHLDAPAELAGKVLDFVGRHEVIRERTRPIRW